VTVGRPGLAYRVAVSARRMLRLLGLALGLAAVAAAVLLVNLLLLGSGEQPRGEPLGRLSPRVLIPTLPAGTTSSTAGSPAVPATSPGEGDERPPRSEGPHRPDD